MREGAPNTLIRQVVGASHIFCTTMNEMMERSLAESCQEPLVLSQIRLLRLISRPHERLRVTDVAEFLGVTNAAASRAIERLVQRELIDRSPSEADRRAVDLSLTEQGVALLARFDEARDRELQRVLREIPADKLKAAASVLDELSVRLAPGLLAEASAS